MLNFTPPIGIIAEIKLQSPSAGVLGRAEDIIPRVKAYEQAGADMISCITENQRFGGDAKFISIIKGHVDLPVLQKDFITNPAQVQQAKQLGSDALLLIASLVSVTKLQTLVNQCNELNIEPIVEVFDKTDLVKATHTATKTIAVNSRNLKTFEISVPHACQIMKKIPSQFIRLGFSGVYGPNEVRQYQRAGASAVLIGTSLMKTNDIHSFIKSLRSI